MSQIGPFVRETEDKPLVPVLAPIPRQQLVVEPAEPVEAPSRQPVPVRRR